MPQDSMRNVVYRSLVTCSDPNGVVEYKTMRKSKSSSRKGQQKAKEVGASEDSNRYSEGIKEELRDVELPSQILDVSRRAQKLNLTIDSWSERISFDGQSKDITRDLLKGALDLQESLVMLYKLQEPSKCLCQMKQSQDKRYRGGMDDVGVERNDSDRFTEKSKHKEIEHRRPSLLDGHSKNSVEELKNVIRDSLTRQNLLSNPIIEEKDYSFGPRKSVNISDIPSTSSSQSSMMNSNNSASMDWSVDSTSKKGKAKDPSLIAKLMGLEDFPREIRSSHLKQQKSNKCLDHHRQVNEIEMPNATNAYSSSYDRLPERKTLKEVIDSMHLKGLLRSNDLEEVEQNPRTSCDSCSKLDDNEFPPIVVMKPIRIHCKEKEDSLPRNSNQEILFDFQKLEAREEASTRRPHQVEGALQLIQVRNKQEAKEELPNRTSLGRKEALSIKKISDKAHKAKETSIKRNTREQVASSSQEKRENYKRTGKAQIVTTERNTSVKMVNAKSVTMLRSADHVRPNPTKTSKRDSVPTITKNLMRHQESLIQNPTLIRSIKSKSAASSTGQVKNISRRKAKLTTESVRTSSVTRRSQPKHVQRESNQSNKIVSSSDPEDQLCIMELKEPAVQIEDLREEQKSSLCEVPMEMSQHGSGIESAEELEHHVDHKIEIADDREHQTDHKIEIEEAFQSETNQKELLSSSPSIAEDHFELHIDQQTAQKPAFTLEAVDMTNPRLYLDCASELMECKSRRMLLAGYPLFWIPAVNVGTRINPERLLGEVCDGIEKLKHYFKVDEDNPAKDRIRGMLESDIMCKQPVTGDLWDLGWDYGYSVKEIDQVLNEVQEQVLNELIEEITIDYC